MRLLSRDIDGRTGGGTVALLPEEGEDMWHLFNLIAVGDTVSAVTLRRVQKESATGSTDGKVRKKLTLAIEVTNVDFDSIGLRMRIAGRNQTESPHIRMGAYHTVELEVNRKVTLTKYCWDSVAIDRVNQACDPMQNAEIAAVVMQEGLAYVCLITNVTTVVRSKIEKSIPRKRPGASGQHAKAMDRFYAAVYAAVLSNVNFEVVKCLVVASPGFVKDSFFAWAMEEAKRTNNKTMLDFRDRFVLAHSSSGHKHALKEALADPGVVAQLADTKAAGEVAALDRFWELLHADPDRAYYGYKHVAHANNVGAVETLLVTDELFRAADISTRRRYVALVDAVKANGGDVRVFSSLHVSGEQLTQLTGVAAILLYAVPEQEASDDGDGEDGNEDGNGDAETSGSATEGGRRGRASSSSSSSSSSGLVLPPRAAARAAGIRPPPRTRFGRGDGGTSAAAGSTAAAATASTPEGAGTAGAGVFGRDGNASDSDDGAASDSDGSGRRERPVDMDAYADFL